MEFHFSTFFSYRRNQNDIKFIYNLKDIIQCEAKYATNLDNVFFDEKCIELGNEFDEKIYDSIKKSNSFLLVFSPIYINKDNDWCARELYLAIKFENYIRNKINNKDFCFIFPLIHRGTANDLPKSVSKKNAKNLLEFISDIKNSSITNHPTTQRFEEFKAYLGKIFLDNYKLIRDFEFDWEEIENLIKPPTKKVLDKWIDEQNQNFRKNESKHLPKLV